MIILDNQQKNYNFYKKLLYQKLKSWKLIILLKFYLINGNFCLFYLKLIFLIKINFYLRLIITELFKY